MNGAAGVKVSSQFRGEILRLKSAFRAALCAAACSLAAVAGAQGFPNKPIKIVVPYAPGGATDLLARTVGQHISEQFAQPVIVENKPGANGMLGSTQVAKSPADGYTLGIASPGNHAANASLYPDIPYDTVKDFTAVSLAVEAPMVLVANPVLNVKSVDDVIKLAKAKPNSISYASGGSGSSMHLAMAQFANMAGLEMIHVPYKGSGNSYVDLLGGRVTLLIDVLPSSLPHVRSGKLIALATAGTRRLPELPNVPTIAETGLRGYSANSWYGFVAPANLPKDVLAKLNGAIVKALKDPEVASKLSKAGLVIVASTPEQFDGFIKAEVDKAARIIKAANIKPD
jgi:tripartite-type tricarboxylate transporter receptor subunit TctC